MSKLDDLRMPRIVPKGSEGSTIMVVLNDENKQQIKDLMLEIIGKDDDTRVASLGKERDAKIFASPLMQRRLHKNELRAELRKKVEEL